MNYLFILLLIFFYGGVSAQAINIGPITAQQVPSALELDIKVTYEFFKPLYASVYQHLNIDRDVDKDLQDELVADAEHFSKLVNNDGLERLYIAWDTEKNMACGLLLFSQLDNDELLLDLLLVDKNYRGKGIGKRLVCSAFNAFKEIRAVHVYPVQFNNNSTLKFYESLGFKNLGIASEEKINSHGIRHSDIYYHFRLDR